MRRAATGRGAGFALAALLLPGAALAQVGTEPPPARPPGLAPMVVETPEAAPEAARFPLLTLNQDALYLHSAWGKRVQAEMDRRGDEIKAENERLAERFSAEEQELSELRQSLPADEFRARADEFDKRVVEVRQERDTALRALQQDADEERTAFLRASLPVLAALMRERGAVAVLDQRAIFVAAQSIDATDALIERIDREIGAGPLAPELVPEAGAPAGTGSDASVPQD